MDMEPGRLRHESGQELPVESGVTPEVTHRQYGSVEVLIREDATGVEVPASVERRLIESLAAEGIGRPSWWRRILGR